MTSGSHALSFVQEIYSPPSVYWQSSIDGTLSKYARQYRMNAPATIPLTMVMNEKIWNLPNPPVF